ncbi:unnamed protein product, partial [Iphiclides podalirius]
MLCGRLNEASAEVRQAELLKPERSGNLAWRGVSGSCALPTGSRSWRRKASFPIGLNVRLANAWREEKVRLFLP